MRLIDADALIERLGIAEKCSECCWSDGTNCKKYDRFVDACEAIYDAPTIEPRRKGKWVVPEGDNYGVIAPTECDQCGFRPQSMRRLFYCPNCGSAMVYEGEDTK